MRISIKDVALQAYAFQISDKLKPLGQSKAVEFSQKITFPDEVLFENTNAIIDTSNINCVFEKNWKDQSIKNYLRYLTEAWYMTV